MVAGLRALSNHRIPCRTGGSLVGLLGPRLWCSQSTVLCLVSCLWCPEARCRPLAILLYRPTSRLVPMCVGAETTHRADLALGALPSCWCTDLLPPSCSGSGCRQEPDRVVNVRLGLCPCTWSQLPATRSDPRQDGTLHCKPWSWS